VERDGRDQRAVERASDASHRPRHRPRDAGTAAIFKLERKRARNRPVGDGSAGAIERRRIGETLAAARIFMESELERLAALAAGGTAEEIERLPAGEAEAVILTHHHAAAGAARRQREGDDRADNCACWAKQSHACLSAAPATGTSPRVEPPEIFSRQLRRFRRDRAATRYAEHSFVRDAIVEGLLDRLDLVTRTFESALDLGSADGSLTRALQARGMTVTKVDAGARFAEGGVQADEDRLPFAPASFDLILSAGVLDQVNDLPGALIQCRRALRPDGLFLAGFVGAGSLPKLKRALLEADQAAGAVPQRIHPLVDVRAAGDLLTRAGFVLTVADGEGLDVGYADPFRLMADLRGMAATNMLAGQTPPALSRRRLAAMADAFAAQADADGRVRERFELVFMTGWAPGPDQPQPARRGSATASLASALKPPSD
jgi:SAM-dependent methyltransferase